MPIYEVEVPLLAPAPDAEPTEEFLGLTPPGQITRPAPAEWLRSYIEPEPVHCRGRAIGRRPRPPYCSAVAASVPSSASASALADPGSVW